MKSLKECQEWYDNLEPDDEQEDKFCSDEPNYDEEKRYEDFDT